MLSEFTLQIFSFFSDKIDSILKKTIFKAREIKEANGLKETVGKTLVQVMEIRGIILERIKRIRRGEVDTCVNDRVHQDKRLEEMRMKVEEVLLKFVKKEAASIDGLKEVSLGLLGWKKAVGDEVMRILMLPEINLNEKFEIATECDECRKLDEISFRVENLLTCAERDEETFTEESWVLIILNFSNF